MDLQEKINKRIEQLETELEQIKVEYDKHLKDTESPLKPMTDYYEQLDILEWKLEMTMKCILELKQLLNN